MILLPHNYHDVLIFVKDFAKMPISAQSNNVKHNLKPYLIFENYHLNIFRNCFCTSNNFLRYEEKKIICEG